jgi:hypothetical protein
MFKVKAKFIGVNSLGFINGRIYEIYLISMPHRLKTTIEIATENHKPKLRCDYGSWEKFILNWEILHFESMGGKHDAEVHHTKVNNGLKVSVRDYKLKRILS